MKLRSGLVGVGVAVAFTLAANTASASSDPCQNGGGEQQIELPQDGTEPCPGTGSTPLVTTVYSASSTPYTVEAEVDDGLDLLQPGEVIEVEMDLDMVMASLEMNPKDAVALAVALGVRSNDAKPGVAKTADTIGISGNKLTEGELKKVASYYIQSRGRATGRSDPAGSFTSRVQATTQAIGRMFSSIAGAIPDFSATYTTTTYHASGQKKKETKMSIELKS